MANTKISDLPSKAVPEYADLIPIVDNDDVSTKKIDFRALWTAGDARFISPSFTYNGSGAITRIDYSDTSYKVFTYTSGRLTQIDFHVFGITSIIRKSLVYSGNTLISITQTTI